MVKSRSGMHLWRSLTVPALALCVTILLPGPALAGIGDGNGEIGFGIGGTEFDSNVSDDTGTLIDFRGGWHFNDLFELEGQLIVSAVEEGPLDQVLSVFFVNGVFNFRPGTEIRPYVLLGVGQANLEADLFGITVDDDGEAFQFAAGSRFFVGQRKKMAVRVEIARLQEKTFDESSDHTNFQVGLTWRIGP